MVHCPTLVALAILFAASCSFDPAATNTAPPSLAQLPADSAVTGPSTHRNLQIWLVHGPDAAGPQRRMVPLAEALKQGLVVVHETGDVGELAIENVGRDLDVYVQSGDIVQGGQQDRTIGVDLALAPGSGRVPLPSFCVEHGRWLPRADSVAGATTQFCSVGVGGAGASAGRAFLSSANAVSTNDLKKAVLVAKDQQAVWEEVAKAQGVLSENLASAAVVDRSSPTSLELSLNTTPVQEAIGGYTAALQAVIDAHADAIGCVIVIGGCIDSADIYGSHALFAQLWPKLLRSAATAAVAHESEPTDAPAITRDQVRAFLADARETEEPRDVPGGVRMSVGANAAAHVIESRVGSGVLHRSWLAR
jgi:hypothetical protein